MLLGVLDELPLIFEGVLVGELQRIQNRPARLSDAERVLEQLHKILRRQWSRLRLKVWMQQRQRRKDVVRCRETAHDNRRALCRRVFSRGNALNRYPK